jgi:hypothetical protein
MHFVMERCHDYEGGRGLVGHNNECVRKVYMFLYAVLFYDSEY